ncbi:MAG: SdpI family protein [Thermoflexales bacterium]
MFKNRWIGLGFIAAMLVFSAVVFNLLPARVPIHWNFNGVADGYGTRELAALFVPGLSLGLWLLFQVLPKLDPLTITSPERFSYGPFLDTFWRFLNYILLFMAGVHVATLGIALGWPIHIGQVMMIGIGLLFVGLGNEFGRLKRNSFAGIRVPWTLANEEVWRISHRVGGRAFVIVGLVSVLCGFIVPPEIGIIVLMILLLGWVVFVMVYSYAVSRRVTRSQQ